MNADSRDFFVLHVNGALRLCLSVMLLSGAMLWMTGCQTKPRTSDRLVQVIDYEKFDRLYSEKKTRDGLVLVDVRNVKAYKAGHIPGAINIPLPDIGIGDARLAKAKRIVVYSAGWMDYLSRAGAKKLMALGYENVMEFREGLEGWQGSHRRVDAIDPPPGDE